MVSIAANPEDFFGEDGIYVTGKEYDAWYEANAEWIADHPKREHDWIWEDEPEPNFMKRGDAWERPGNVEVLRDGEVMNEPAGFRISGSSTRDAFVKRHNECYIDVSKIDCDAYNYKKNDPEAVRKYRGEYMIQYDWAFFHAE